MSTHEFAKQSRRIVGIVSNEKFNLKNKATEILIEIIIIVFAISLSLLLDRWRQNQDDHNLEKKFLSGLKSDLTQDLSELKNSSTKLVSMEKAAAYFLKPEVKLKNAPDSTNYYSYKLFHNVYFFPNTNRYESLKSTGKLNVVENEQLQNDIIDLYQTKVPDLEQQVTFFNQFLNDQVKNYLIVNFKRDQNNNIILDRSFFNSPQMKNILSFYSDLNDVLKRSKSTISLSEKILKEIDSESK